MSRLRSAWGWFRGGRRRPIRTRVPSFRFRPTVELLAERVLPAVTATFANGVLTVTGDELDNSIAVSRDAAGTLVVNGDGLIVPVQGGTATAANTTLIRIFGMGGNDELIWSRSANLPRALVDGGAGDDIITSGTGNDTLVGGAGNDVYRLDTDTALGSDTIDESGGGIDTLDFSSTTTRAVSINLGTAAAQVVNAGLTLTLSAGNTIENVIGGDLNDTLTGNGLNNVIQGSAGNDTLVGAAGKDTFQWNPGDGNDVVDGVTGDGLGGSDGLVVNGSDVAERFVISAVGNGGRVTRDVDNVILDLVGVEAVTVNANGGADTITVNDLSATAVTAVNLDLGGFGTGDGASDSVIVNGTNGNDAIQIIGFAFDSTSLSMVGLSARVGIIDSEPIDHLTVNTLGGFDTVDTSSLPAGVIGLTVNLGDGQTAATSTTLSPSTATAVFGQPVTLLAEVTSEVVPTGTVTFRDGTAVLGTVPVDDSGQAALTVSLGVGNHALTASFAGTGGFADSSSAAAAVTVNRGATAVALQSSVNPVVTGQAVTFTAGVAAVAPGDGRPTGTVTFRDGTVVLGTVAVGAGGTATLTTSFAVAGGHLITAVYNGDPNFNGSSQVLTVQVNATAPRVTGVIVNGGANQRSIVTQTTIAFDQHVLLPANPADAFRLVRLSDSASVLLRASVDDTGAGTVVTLTFIGGAVDGVSLADGRYTLTVLAGQVSTGGAALDGDGDGQAGGDFVVAGDPATNRLFRLYGDVNGDGTVNGLDLAAFRNTFGTTVGSPAYLAFLDSNGDGAINVLDLTAFRARFGVLV
jgi:hypothetical protein